MLPLDIYNAHLELINGIRFTPREIDIIACILNGRSAKTIPALLSIAPKTVAAHMENIRSKAECSSREGIIDFIERSEKCIFIKNEYYLNLLTQNSFEKCLREFSKLVLPKELACSLIYEQENNVKFSLFYHLKQHLNLAGFKVESKIQKSNIPVRQCTKRIDCQPKKYILYVLPDVEKLPEGNLDSLEREMFSQKTARPSEELSFLFFNNKECNQNIKRSDKIQSVNFSEQNNYYFSFFEVLKIIYPHKSADKIFAHFKQQIDLTPPVAKNPNPLMTESNRSISEEAFLKKIYTYLFPVFLLKKSIYFPISIVFLLTIFVNHVGIFHEKKLTEEFKNTNIKEARSIRSDLVIPTTASFLNRSELISQIDNKFKGDEGIKSLAIVGIGGAGKTTLARQYAQQQKASVVWEINAETQGDLNTSFEKLGAALSKADEDKRELRIVQDIKDPQEREEKLIQFVKARLKEISNWLLIFDNVETLAEIQKYFPQDPQTWGAGKVILTTRDHNLQNNNQINHVVFIKELDKTEKLNLFKKIMSSGITEAFTAAQREEAGRFLDNIPPFPLDVSVAAYYLKSTNSSHQEYTENIKNYKESFERFQGNIIKENGSYSKTRYGIITLSLKKIIAESKDFSDLLLFISLLNAQDIPRDLLEKYKDPIVVASFIYHLKKYSLLTNGLSPPSTVVSSLSLHHSTQDISLPYLVQQLGLNKESPSLKAISNTLDDYMDQAIEQEDFPKMKMMTGHLEKFLDQSNLLTDLSKGLLESKLGSIYYFVNEKKAHKILQDGLELLKTQNLDHLSPEDNARIARSFLYIGAFYTELRLYTEAEQILEKAIGIYEKRKLKNYADLSWGLSHLGNVHRRLGNYEMAKDYIEESLHLNTEYSLDNKRRARTLAYIGNVYGRLGFYQKSIDVLHKSLDLYKEHYAKDHFRVGWVLIGLGQAYRRSGDYGKSLDCLNQSLKIHQKYFDDNHLRIGWILFQLAATYKSMGNREDASKLCAKILKIYTPHCDEESIGASRLLRDMAKIYFELNQLDEAEKLVKKSLKILQDRNHVDAFKSLETLGEIYLRKSIQSVEAKNTHEGEDFKRKALDNYTQALAITEQNFPKNSVHIERVLLNIKKTQEGI